MKAAIYCRVSTEDQAQEGTSLNTQLEACLKYCQDKSYEVTHRFSEAYSGLSLDRPKLNELRELVRAGDIEVIVVYCLDRLSRDPTHGVILTLEMEKHHVTLEAVSEDVDNSELGKLISYIRGFASKLEVEKIKERTARGKGELIKKGILPQGTGVGLYGYRWDKQSKRRIPIELEAKIVERIFTMIAEGMSRFNVAKILNGKGIPTKSGGKWHPLTIERMITNSAYIGETYFGKTLGSKKTSLQPRPKEDWRLLPDVTPPIITRELWEQTQKVLLKAKELHPGNPKYEYLLSGHILCGHCGSPMVGACLARKHRYYHCRGTYPTATREKICKARYIRADMVEEIAWGKVKEVLENPKVVLAELERQSEAQRNQVGNGSTLDKEIAALRRKSRSYDAQQKRLVSLFRHGEFGEDIVLDQMNQLKQERQQDEEQLSQLIRAKEQLARIANAEIKLNEFCERVRQNLAQCSIEDKKLALDALDVKVTATHEYVEIAGAIPIEATPMPSSGNSESLLTIAQTSA